MPYAPDSNVFGWNVVDAVRSVLPDGSGIAPQPSHGGADGIITLNSPNEKSLATLLSLSTG